MKLRLRLAIATTTVAIATVVAMLWMDRSGRHQEGATRLIANIERVLAHPDEQARCEAAPGVWTPRGAPELPDQPTFNPQPPPRPDGREMMPEPPALDPELRPIELFVLDRELRAARLGGPPLDREAMRELATNDAVALPTSWWSDSVAIIVRTPWRAGPCAFIYAHSRPRRRISAVLPSGLWLLFAGITSAVLITMGPVVRRIRRLSDAVAASGNAGFVGEIPVEGGDEIAGLARSFAAASRAVRSQLFEMEQREAVLRDFLANTTHDVMIPLTVLQMHLATMQEDEQVGRARNADVLTSAMDEAHYLGALMQNLAAVAKLDTGVWQPVIGAVDLNALVQRVVSRHQAIARRLDVSVDFAAPDDPLATAADLTLIEQAVNNVVYNAIRHNRAGGHVALTLEATAGDRFLVRVVDDGPGVPADELARLVERGFRGNAARTRSPDGLGLGLNITLRVARLHQLDLRFGRSEYGGLQVDLEGPCIATS